MPNRRMRDRVGPPATILGRGIVLRGSLEGSGHFLVSGTVIGDAEIDGALTLADGGRWKGIIRVDDVILAGTLEGELHARGKVEITASARIDGRVVGGGISIARGAIVEGELQSLGDAPVATFEDRRQR